MKRLARATVAAVTVLGLGIPGIVGAATSVDTSGPGAHSTVSTTNSNEMSVKNKNDIRGTFTTSQNADSGHVKMHNNTTGGDASSGAASNDNSVGATVNVDNGSSTSAATSMPMVGSDVTVDTSGPGARSKVTENNTNKVTVTNTNNVTLSNSVTQHATSGNVTVNNNTTAGNATSGDASNTSSSTFDISVTN